MCLCVFVSCSNRWDKQRRTGCLTGVQLWRVVSCVNSGALWLLHFHGKHLFRGLQVFNMLIYTSKQHRKGIVLKGARDYRRREGRVMKDALFSLFSPSGVGRGLSLWGRHIDAIMIAFNQTHDQMEGFLFSRQKQSGITAEVFPRLFYRKTNCTNPGSIDSFCVALDSINTQLPQWNIAENPIRKSVAFSGSSLTSGPDKLAAQCNRLWHYLTSRARRKEKQCRDSNSLERDRASLLLKLDITERWGGVFFKTS